MPIDVATLFYMLVGTTLTNAALMAWERRFSHAHRREMTLWAVGLVAVSAGCIVRLLGAPLPYFVAIGLSNLLVMAGYAAVTVATIVFTRGAVSRLALAGSACVMIAWLCYGQYASQDARIVFTSTAVAVLCFYTVAVLKPEGSDEPLASRRLVRSLFAAHGLFFAGRVCATLAYPPETNAFHSMNFAVTMIEGILWSTLAPPAFLIMAREETQRQLTVASETDFLTGVDNRRAFMAKAASIVADASAPSAVVLFDLDHFKRINDCHGHALGDDILKQFCRVVEALVTQGDVFGRLGGEEFAVVFRNCAAADAQLRAGLILRLYTAETATRFPCLTLRATVSGGIAPSRAGVPLEQLLQEADTALYAAKKAGRDQTVLAEARPAPFSSAPEMRAA